MRNGLFNNSKVIKMIDTIKKRRSIRNYTPDQILEKDLYEILSAGLYAPSGKNRQPWRFVVVKDKDELKRISKFTTYSRFIRNVPALVLVYVISSVEYPIEKDMLSVGACVQNILLTATDMGYGSCVIGELYSAELKILDTKSCDYKLICGISIGKSNAKVQENESISLEEFLLNEE